MASYLDIAQPIIEIDKDTGEMKATPYFEDYLFQLVQSTGGEGSELISTVINSGVQTDKVPYLMGLIYTLSRKISDLEARIGTHVIESNIKKLQIDTANFISKIKSSDYTAKRKEWIEARSRATIKLPENADRDTEVMVANGDGSRITVDGNGTDIKYTSTDTTFIMGNEGSSYHFHLFVDNPNNTRYWRVV